MGTNYYLHKPKCECCDRPAEDIHLGKLSCGWNFLFRKNPQAYNFETFCKYIERGLAHNAYIKDEYDRKITYEEFLKIIKTRGKSHTDPVIEQIGDYDFLDMDFC